MLCDHVAVGNDLRVISAFWRRVRSLGTKGYKRPKPSADGGEGKLPAETGMLECLLCGGALRETENKGDSRLECGECGGPVIGIHRQMLHLYCCRCDDVVYNSEFDAARCHALLTCTDNESKTSSSCAQISSPIAEVALEPGVGLRGMSNLGNTCYMNSVLQVLAQQSIIRDFYLSNRHNRKCKIAKRSREDASSVELKNKLRSMLEKNLNDTMAQIKKQAEMKELEKVAENVPSAMEMLEKMKKSKNKKRRAPNPILDDWYLVRNSSFMARYACSWHRPWSPQLLEEKQEKPGQAQLAIAKTNGSSVAAHGDPVSSELLSQRKADLGSMQVNGTNSAAGNVSTTHPQAEELQNDIGCIACELETMVKDLYCGPNTRSPLVLNHFLYSTWLHSPLLSGYMQQDAHEFFSFVINSAHKAHDGAEAWEAQGCKDGELCKCVMHQAFGGMLCSQITCSGCGATSDSLEPFFDISLDCPSWIGYAVQSTPSPRSKRQKTSPGNSESSSMATSAPGGKVPGQAAANPMTASAKYQRVIGSPRREANALTRGLSFNAPPIKLQTLLENFLAPETLAAAIQCERCGTRCENSSKRLHLQTLPPVLCFHIKRFKTGSTPANAQKSDQAITFPAKGLDMTNFIMKDKNNSPKDPLLYDLCAVIQHTGTISAGHYVCFVLHHGSWFRCDDNMVRRVIEFEVLESQAYMLYYQKRTK